MGRWIGLVGTHGPGWLGWRGARFEVLVEESVVEGAVTDTEGLGGSLVAEEIGAGIEDGDGKNGRDAGGGDEGEEGGEQGEDGCGGDIAEGNSSTEAPLDTESVAKATVFSADPEPTVKAREGRPSRDAPEDAGSRSSVAFSVLGILGKLGSPEELLGASDGVASGLEWPFLHAVGLKVFWNRHGVLENMGKGNTLTGWHVGLGATLVSSDAEAGTIQDNLGTLLNFFSDPCVGEGCGNDIAIVSRAPEAMFSSTGSATEDTG